ncbi:hypothetical protein TNCV_436531 [Trichonephila clavipes]|nr:hypothetical protein TNCV_436531 [Trichonephila clavipes]
MADAICHRDYLIGDYHQHVVTGHLSIVKDDLLRNFMENVPVAKDGYFAWIPTPIRSKVEIMRLAPGSAL